MELGVAKEAHLAGSRSTIAVLLMLGANLAVVVAKLTAAAWTNSSAMLSEAIHSLVGISSEALQQVGLRRSEHSEGAADGVHTVATALESAFWGLVVGVLLFSMGAGVSIYDGVHKLFDPQPLADAHINYVVLAVAMCLAAPATIEAVRDVGARHPEMGMFEALRRAQDATLFTRVVKNIAAMAGLVIALSGVLAAHLMGVAWADGLASVAIGLLMALVAAFMAIELRSLITGEPADYETIADVGVQPAGYLVSASSLENIPLLTALADEASPVEGEVDPDVTHSGSARGKKAKKNRRRS